MFTPVQFVEKTNSAPFGNLASCNTDQCVMFYKKTPSDFMSHENFLSSYLNLCLTGKAPRVLTPFNEVIYFSLCNHSAQFLGCIDAEQCKIAICRIGANSYRLGRNSIINLTDLQFGRCMNDKPCSPLNDKIIYYPERHTSV